MKITRIVFLSLLFLLTGCGSSESDSFNGTVTATLPITNAKGGFQAISSAQLFSQRELTAAVPAEFQDVFQPRYDVTVRVIEYMTPDRNGTLQRASGIVVYPNTPDPSPILSYQHPTIFYQSQAPSRTFTDPSQSIELHLAAQGYIVVSADYLGFGTTDGLPHPYLQRIPSANTVIDLLNAAKQWLSFRSIPFNDELYMTGYSQGAYVTMAALQALQLDQPDITVTDVSMGAGPYDLRTTLDELLMGIEVPSFLQNTLRDLLQSEIIPDDSDVSIDLAFLDRYFADDDQDDVHNWRPTIPIHLFHGTDDATVPIESSFSTRDTMTALGSSVDLQLCTLTPSTHRACVSEFILNTLQRFEASSRL